jgi:hypothetical protein
VPDRRYRQLPDGSYEVELEPGGRRLRTALPPGDGFAAFDKLGGFEAPDDAAGVRSVQDTRVAGTPHLPPPAETQAERFDRFDKLGTGPQSAPVPPRSSAPAAFARSAAAAALDTAALPVTLPARAYRAAGGRGETLDTIADLSADEALQDATWLATGEEAGDYRRRVAAEREQFPNASAAGVALGTAVGGLGLEGLAERGIARGVGAARELVVFDNEAARAAAKKTLGAKKLTQPELERAFGVGDKAREAWGPNQKELDFWIDSGGMGSLASEAENTRKGAFGLRIQGDPRRGEFSWTIDKPGKLAKLELVKLPPEARGKGTVSEMLERQLETFDRLGIKRVELSAVEDGLVMWPRLGLEAPSDVTSRLTSDFNRRYGQNAGSLREIALSGPDGEQYLRAQGQIDGLSTSVASLREALASQRLRRSSTSASVPLSSSNSASSESLNSRSMSDAPSTRFMAQYSTGQAKNATRDQAQEKQRAYSEPYTPAGKARRIAERR